MHEVGHWCSFTWESMGGWGTGGGCRCSGLEFFESLFFFELCTDNLSTSALRASTSDCFWATRDCCWDTRDSIWDCFSWFSVDSCLSCPSMELIRASMELIRVCISILLLWVKKALDMMSVIWQRIWEASGLRFGKLLKHCRISPLSGWTGLISWR